MYSLIKLLQNYIKKNRYVQWYMNNEPDVSILCIKTETRCKYYRLRQSPVDYNSVACQFTQNKDQQ